MQMTKSSILVLAELFIVMMLSVEADAQSPYAHIFFKFKVVNAATRMPIEGVNVTLWSNYSRWIEEYLASDVEESDKNGWSWNYFKWSESAEGSSDEERGRVEVVASDYHYIDFEFTMEELNWAKKDDLFRGLRVLTDAWATTFDEYIQGHHFESYQWIELEVPMVRVGIKVDIENERSDK